MINPASLFVACLLTLAANPSLVASIPLPPPPSSLPHRFPTSLFRHRSFKSTGKLPILRIVDDEQPSETALWTETFTEESILPESIFASDDKFGSNLLDHGIVFPHLSHNIYRRDLPRPSSSTKSGAKASTNSKKTKRSLTGKKHEKRYSLRWMKSQEEAKSRSAEAAAKASSTSSIVWTKVSTTSRTFAPSTTTAPVSASSTTTSNLAPSASPTAATLTGTHTGEGTWFAPGLGACGTVATDDSPIVAVSHLLYDSYPGATRNPNLNPICGQKIRATYQGKSVDVTVQDRCEGCAMWDLDFSPKLFGELADLGIGRLKGVEWTFI
ncbi:hypothetical protein JCM5350_007707 [Sporobolomyces pararoseus]